jgi:DivIVA domain-containing protein
MWSEPNREGPFMPTNDLDLPLQMSAEQIRRREFATVRRGYDPDQVRDYLGALAGQLERLEAGMRTAQASAQKAELNAAHKAEHAAPTSEGAGTSAEAGAGEDPYEALGKRFAALLGTADTEATRVVEEARTEAARILDEARSDADATRVDAQARAEEARAEGQRLLERARQEAERSLSGLAARREELVTQLQAMQERLLSAAKDLEVTLDDPSRLPGPIAEAEAKAAAERPVAPRMPTQQAPGTSPSPKRVDDPGDLVDPRYEDLWVSDDKPVDIPDLASIELDFDEGPGAEA